VVGFTTGSREKVPGKTCEKIAMMIIIIIIIIIITTTTTTTTGVEICRFRLNASFEGNIKRNCMKIGQGENKKSNNSLVQHLQESQLVKMLASIRKSALLYTSSITRSVLVNSCTLFLTESEYRTCIIGAFRKASIKSIK
jgi:hypothetical protein